VERVRAAYQPDRYVVCADQMRCAMHRLMELYIVLAASHSAKQLYSAAAATVTGDTSWSPPYCIDMCNLLHACRLISIKVQGD
jgi:hypothetical protein